MSKSLGNIITIDTMIERDIDPLVFRFMYLNHHYRSTLEYDEKILQNTMKSYNNFRAAISHLGSQASEIGVPLTSLIDEFKEVIGDDLALPRALTVAWKVLREDVGGPEDRLATIIEMDKVLGLSLEVLIKETLKPIPKEILQMVDEREVARKEKDWKRADTLREEVMGKGYMIQDTQEGPQIIVSPERDWKQRDKELRSLFNL